MIAAVVEFDKDSRVTQVLLVGMTENEVAVAERGLVRLIRPRCWAWLRRLLKRGL
jgi:hypothetical protein